MPAETGATGQLEMAAVTVAMVNQSKGANQRLPTMVRASEAAFMMALPCSR